MGRPTKMFLIWPHPSPWPTNSNNFSPNSNKPCNKLPPPLLLLPPTNNLPCNKPTPTFNSNNSTSNSSSSSSNVATSNSNGSSSSSLLNP